MSESPPPPRATDSPWFWLGAFSAMGLMLVLLIAPKYQRRQDAIERRFLVRQEIAKQRALGKNAAEAAEDETSGQAEDGSEAVADRELLVPLTPIVVALVLLLIVSRVAWGRERKRLQAAAEAEESSRA